jgi:hypothetical protein
MSTKKFLVFWKESEKISFILKGLFIIRFEEKITFAGWIRGIGFTEMRITWLFPSGPEWTGKTEHPIYFLE